MTKRLKSSLVPTLIIFIVIWLVLSVAWWSNNIIVYNGGEDKGISLAGAWGVMLGVPLGAFVIAFLTDME